MGKPPSSGRRFRLFAALGFAALAASCAGPVDPRIPGGYDSGYHETIAAAERGGQLVIWSTTDDAQVKDLLAGFRRRYPRIAVTYRDMPGIEIYNGFLADLKQGRPPADLLWNSAMDLQIKLVNDGYALRYPSPERKALPDWANWKDEAWGITAEPIVMIYNQRLIAPADVPDSHLAFRQALEKGTALRGRVATYDPQRSAVGYLYFSQDGGAARDLWRTVRALGANRARLFSTTEAIIDDVSSGGAAIGYNVVGSYAADEIRKNPDLRVVLPTDYTLIMSRIAIIPARAPHPDAARLFLDYLLSRDGQRELAVHSMTPVRRDIARPPALRTGDEYERAIRVGPALLVQQDRLTRARFMAKWREAIAGSVNPPEQRIP